MAAAAAAAEPTLWFTALMTRRAGKPETPDCFGFSWPVCAVFARSVGNATQWRATVVFPLPRHMSTCSEWGERVGKRPEDSVGGWGGAQRVIDLLLLLLPLSCRARTRLPSFRFWPVQDSLEFRPAFYSASFLPSACPSPSTLDQCDNNATSAVAFASARQTLCASRPAAALQSAYPVTHTHTRTIWKVCLCLCLSVGPNAAYANVLTKHARPSICQVAKNQARIF